MYCSTLQSEELRPLDYAGFSALFTTCRMQPRVRTASPTHAGRWQENVFDGYSLTSTLLLLGGGDVPSDFNESYMVFIPKATVLPREFAYQGPPSRYRPLNPSNTAQKIVSKALNATLETAAMTLVSPTQRGFIKNRSLLDNILDVEFVMESAVIVGARQAGTVLVRYCCSLPFSGLC